MSDDRHLHVLARNKGNLTGSGEQMTAADVEAMFNGTPYRDELELWHTVTGKIDRGYVVVAEGWVAVVRCRGASQSECADVLVNVATSGDIRAARQAGSLPGGSQ